MAAWEFGIFKTLAPCTVVIKLQASISTWSILHFFAVETKSIGFAKLPRRGVMPPFLCQKNFDLLRWLEKTNIFSHMFRVSIFKIPGRYGKKRSLYWLNSGNNNLPDIRFQPSRRVMFGRKQHRKWQLYRTLPRTRIAPENRLFREEPSLPTIHFQVWAVSLREGRLFFFVLLPKNLAKFLGRSSLQKLNLPRINLVLIFARNLSSPRKNNLNSNPETLGFSNIFNFWCLIDSRQPPVDNTWKSNSSLFVTPVKVPGN